MSDFCARVAEQSDKEKERSSMMHAGVPNYIRPFSCHCCGLGIVSLPRRDFILMLIYGVVSFSFLLFIFWVAPKKIILKMYFFYKLLIL